MKRPEELGAKTLWCWPLLCLSYACFFPHCGPLKVSWKWWSSPRLSGQVAAQDRAPTARPIYMLKRGINGGLFHPRDEQRVPHTTITHLIEDLWNGYKKGAKRKRKMGVMGRVEVQRIVYCRDHIAQNLHSFDFSFHYGVLLFEFIHACLRHKYKEERDLMQPRHLMLPYILAFSIDLFVKMLALYIKNHNCQLLWAHWRLSLVRNHDWMY